MLFYLFLCVISMLQCKIVYGDNNQSQISCDDCTKILEELNSPSTVDFEDHVNFIILASTCAHASSSHEQDCANQVLSVPLLQLVPFNLNSRSICSFMGACSQTAPNKEEVENFVLHSALPQLVNNVMLFEECEHCLSVVDGISALLSDKETQPVVKIVVNTLCNILPQQEFPECEEFLYIYYDQVFLLASEYLMQNEFCSQYQYCPATSKNYIEQPETMTQNSSPIDFLPSEECLSCQLVEGAISALLLNDQNKHIAKTNLNAICNQSQECLNILDLYIDQIFEILLQYLQGDALCAQTENCPDQKYSVQIPDNLFLLENILSDGGCQYCYMAAGEVFAFFQNDLTKQIIFQNFDDMLEPDSVLKTILGNVFVEEVLQSLLKFILEDEFCVEFGYCSETFGGTFFPVY